MSDSGQNLYSTWFVCALVCWQPLNSNQAWLHESPTVDEQVYGAAAVLI